MDIFFHGDDYRGVKCLHIVFGDIQLHSRFLHGTEKSAHCCAEFRRAEIEYSVIIVIEAGTSALADYLHGGNGGQSINSAVGFFKAHGYIGIVIAYAAWSAVGNYLIIGQHPEKFFDEIVPESNVFASVGVAVII